MDWQTNGSLLIGNCASYGLSNSLIGIGRKSMAFGRVAFLYASSQANRAFLNQNEQFELCYLSWQWGWPIANWTQPSCGWQFNLASGLSEAEKQTFCRLLVELFRPLLLDFIVGRIQGWERWRKKITPVHNWGQMIEVIQDDELGASRY